MDLIPEFRGVPKVSARGVASFFTILAENHKCENAEFISESKSRRTTTLFNKIFLEDFESKNCSYTRESDGGGLWPATLWRSCANSCGSSVALPTT